MTDGSGRARPPQLPEGFVDAIGLDDESIPFKPFVVRTKTAATPQPPEAERRAGRRERSTPDRTPAWGK